MFKRKLHNHPRNKHISFDKESHTYMYKDEEFQGITSLIGRYTKPFDRDKVSKSYGRKHGMSQNEVLSLWQSDQEYGNNLHDAVEDYINDGVLHPDFEEELENFQAAMDQYKLKPIAAEFVIYDEDIKRASMIDVVCEKDGKIVIVDTKTMKNGIKMRSFRGRKMVYPLNHLYDNNYWKYCLQVTTYKDWMERLYGMPVADINYILHLRPEGYKMIPVLPLEKELKLIYEDINESTTV